ncbi:MAG: signal recognition particle-docking protein FtsY [Candidatus Aenigmarchaeota archaeon]|nr:signal recognition particle-docking protein FtsY [Candidatus Aenigmarchaeota archaeon]
MFDGLKKKLKESVAKLTQRVAEKDEATFEQEEQFTHEKTLEPEQLLKTESEQIDRDQETEEHAEAESPAEEPEPAEQAKESDQEVARRAEKPYHKETLEERESPEPKETLEDKVLEKEERLEKRGVLKRLRGFPAKIAEKSLSANDIDEFIGDVEADLLASNVALEVVDFFRAQLKKELVDAAIRRGQTADHIQAAFRTALLRTVDHGQVDLESLKRPATILFLGFNGSGKTTSIAKVARYLQSRGKTVVIAAADTFRAASIEQLEVHADKLKVKVVKHQYGGDPAAVVFDARKHAEANRIDYVLADTAGRTHVDKNLIDELKKIVRVNRPELKVLVIDSLTGNDAVEQAKLFDQAVGVDAVILTKLDVNKKGGSLLSVCYAIKKPILFLGTGQDQRDLQPFEPQAFVDELLSG